MLSVDSELCVELDSVVLSVEVDSDELPVDSVELVDSVDSVVDPVDSVLVSVEVPDVESVEVSDDESVEDVSYLLMSTLYETPFGMSFFSMLASFFFSSIQFVRSVEP